MNTAIALLSSIAFALALRWLGIASICTQALNSARASAALLGNTAIGDVEKEAAARRAAVEMLRYGVVVPALLLLALVPPTVLILLAIYLGFIDQHTLMAAFLSLPIIAVGLAVLVYEFVRPK